MPPKKATSTTKKPSGAAPAHASYQDMIKEAILSLKERNGSSRQAIKKYIQANNNLGGTTEAAFTTHLSKALASGEKNGIFSRPKGPSGPVKLAKKDTSKPAAKATTSAPAKSAAKPTTKSTPKKSSEKTSETKAATKKATAAPKKTSTSTTKTAKKPAATKPKANASKPRKTAAPAPAVEDKPPVVLGKTKSGRVTKSTAPAAPKQTRKPSTKKASAKKASTPKKAATPKKSEAVEATADGE